jgi:hypothetical protein
MEGGAAGQNSGDPALESAGEEVGEEWWLTKD